MLYHGLDGISARTQILARVEFGRVFCDEFTDLGSEGKSQIGVDVDLTDTVLGSFSDHLLRNTLSAGNIAAVLIALVHEFLENCGGAMEYQRGVRYKLMYGL